MNHLRPSSLSLKYFASTGLVFSYCPLFFEHHHTLLSQLKLATDSVYGAFSDPSHGVAALFQLFAPPLPSWKWKASVHPACILFVTQALEHTSVTLFLSLT